MRKTLALTYSYILILCGSILLMTGAAVSSRQWESLLVSDPARTLSWGPLLFRVLLVIHGLALLAYGIYAYRCAGMTKISPPPPIIGTDAQSHQPTDKRVWGLLAVLAILAIALRIVNLNSDLWLDEILTLTDFARLPVGDIVTTFPSQNQHMLYSLLAHASMALFGESAWALRLPSVLFAVGSLFALFLLGRRVIGTRESLLACALMTVSYHHIWFSQNARGYMGLLFFTLLASWLWLEAQSSIGFKFWIYYSVAIALGMWIHMTMMFVVAAHALIYLVTAAVQFKKSSTRTAFSWKPVLAWVFCATLILQLHALSLPEFLKTGLHEVSVPSDWTNPFWVLTESLKSLQVGFSAIIVVLGALTLVASGCLSIFRQNPRVGALLILPALLAGSSMVLLGHNIWPRFFFFSMGFALLILVHSAMTVSRFVFARVAALRANETLHARLGLALTMLIILASVATIPKCYRLPKQNFSGARDYVEQNRDLNDAVVSVGLAGTAYGRYFSPRWSVAQTETDLENICRQNNKVWLLYTIPIEVRAYHPEIWGVIEKRFETVKVFPGTLGGGEVYVCRQRVQADLSAIR
jgi:hypothetical protein